MLIIFRVLCLLHQQTWLHTVQLYFVNPVQCVCLFCQRFPSPVLYRSVTQLSQGLSPTPWKACPLFLSGCPAVTSNPHSSQTSPPPDSVPINDSIIFPTRHWTHSCSVPPHVSDLHWICQRFFPPDSCNNPFYSRVLSSGSHFTSQLV